MTACFIVRAKIADAVVNGAFDRWYQVERLPDALKGFNARRAWRGWSAVDPLMPQAFYEFDDMARAQAIQGSEALKTLVAEFDRAWGDRVMRSRDIVEDIQTVSTTVQ